MTKKEAIELLGGTATAAAKAIGYKTAHGVVVWKDGELNDAQRDRVTAAYARKNLAKHLPASLK